MKTHPIIVLLSGNGSNLQSIIDNCKNVHIQNVISDKYDAHGLDRAVSAQIDNVVFSQPADQTRKDYCEYLARVISGFKPELVVLAGFMKILTPNFFDYFHEKQIVNIHPSLLPKHKGGGPSHNTHQIVLDEGDEEHGMTIHYAIPELDAGPTIWQSSFFIQPEDTADTLETRVHELEHQWYPWVIDRLVTGEI